MGLTHLSILRVAYGTTLNTLRAALIPNNLNSSRGKVIERAH